jgi:hypothetical protein
MQEITIWTVISSKQTLEIQKVLWNFHLLNQMFYWQPCEQWGRLPIQITTSWPAKY